MIQNNDLDDILEKTKEHLEEAARNNRIANRYSNLALVFAIASILLLAIANLDVLISFLHWLQSCLR